MHLKFGVLMFKEIIERLKSFRVRNITFFLYFCCSHLKERKKMCKFYLYMETNILIRLNIFNTEDFLESLLRENFLRRLLREDSLGSLKEDILESLVDPKIKYMRRLLEDFSKTSL